MAHAHLTTEALKQAGRKSSFFNLVLCDFIFFFLISVPYAKCLSLVYQTDLNIISIIMYFRNRKYDSGFEKRKKKQRLEVAAQSLKGALDRFVLQDNNVV
jgi:hypothetical protein